MTITWAILADGAQARILESRGPGQGLTIVEHIDHADGGWEGSGPSDGPPETSFADELGARLRSARLLHRFDRLVLAADPPFLRRLRAALDRDTQRLVAGEIPKHLVHAADRDVEGQLAALVA